GRSETAGARAGPGQRVCRALSNLPEKPPPNLHLPPPPGRFIRCPRRAGKPSEERESPAEPSLSHRPPGRMATIYWGNDPMRSMNLLQLVGGVAAAGVVAAGATAVTGSGVSWGVGSGVGNTAFVGGTITQTVSGAVVDSVAYDWDDTATKTK